MFVWSKTKHLRFVNADFWTRFPQGKHNICISILQYGLGAVQKLRDKGGRMAGTAAEEVPTWPKGGTARFENYPEDRKSSEEKTIDFLSCNIWMSLESTTL